MQLEVLLSKILQIQGVTAVALCDEDKQLLDCVADKAFDSLNLQRPLQEVLQNYCMLLACLGVQPQKSTFAVLSTPTTGGQGNALVFVSWQAPHKRLGLIIGLADVGATAHLRFNLRILLPQFNYEALEPSAHAA